jgi:hypothetical protein
MACNCAAATKLKGRNHLEANQRWEILNELSLQGSISRLLQEKFLLPYLENLDTAKAQILRLVNFAKQSLDVGSLGCP